MPPSMLMANKSKAPLHHRRKLNAARIARYRAQLRDGQSVFKGEVNKAEVILALRGLASSGMIELMLTKDPTRAEIEKKLSMLLCQITVSGAVTPHS
jgi:hypothetical protein